MDLPHIVAAGGIVVRHDPQPCIGIVQLRKNRAWVLPKGKLSRNETALAAARREVLEETGHEVSVHEFVGALSYESRGLPKVVQFWRMQALDRPLRKLTRDVRAVEWLPLPDAIERLTRAHERVFLEHVGPVVLRAAAEKKRARTVVRRKPARARVSTAPKRPTRVPASIEPTLHVEATTPAVLDRPVLSEVHADALPDVRHEMPAVAPLAKPTANTTGDESAARPRPWLRRQLIDRLLGRTSRVM